MREKEPVGFYVLLCLLHFRKRDRTNRGGEVSERPGHSWKYHTLFVSFTKTGRGGGGAVETAVGRRKEGVYVLMD